MDRRGFVGRMIAGSYVLTRDAALAEPPRIVRVGMAQMLVRTGALEENLARATAFVERARAERCQVVVLPECLDLGWTHPGARTQALPIPGPASARLAEAARKNGIWVVAGLTERNGEQLHNTSILLDDQGRLIHQHRKINELPIAWDLYVRGTSLAVADTPFGRVGITICADNAPGSVALGLALGKMGARLILSPCAWAVPTDHDNERKPYGRDIWDRAYHKLTVDYPMAVVGVSNVGRIESGPWTGQLCIGSSLAMGPGGVVLARAPFGADAETLLPVDVPLPERPTKNAPPA